MKILWIFTVTFIIGCLGSIYPGPVKLSIVQVVMQKNLRVGLWAAIGASLPEILGSALAIYSFRWLQQVPDVLIWFQWSVIPILLIIGFLTLQKKSTPDVEKQESASPANRSAFTKEMVLNLCNPQLVPFWLVTTVWFNSKPGLSLDSFGHELFFILGATGGSFAMNYLYAKLTSVNRERILDKIQPQTIRLLTGWGFILLGVWQAVQAFA